MPKSSLLWKIEQPEWKGACYLFGTMHAHDSRVLKFAERLQPYIQGCEALACETDMDANPLLQNDFLLPQGQRLRDLLPQNDYRLLQRFFERNMGNSLEEFERFQPMILQNILTESAFLNDSSEVIDQRLWSLARGMGKDLWGLERREDEQKVIGKLTMDWQIKTLSKTLCNLSKTRSKAKRVLNAYLEQNLAYLHKTAKRGGGKMRKWLIFERNRAMSKRFVELAAHSTLFAAVGVGHLFGGKGMLRLLRNKGAKIKAIRF